MFDLDLDEIRKLSIKKLLDNLPSEFQNPDLAEADDRSICLEWDYYKSTIFIDFNLDYSISFFASFNNRKIKSNFYKFDEFTLNYIKSVFELILKENSNVF